METEAVSLHTAITSILKQFEGMYMSYCKCHDGTCNASFLPLLKVSRFVLPGVGGMAIANVILLQLRVSVHDMSCCKC